ncbi:hypothetical protein PQ455_02400 [Sphingomonas naphthae]|uniref:Uncharacterized protein n=1 Tax=Sphingomonas naphthae TaxID=1813468 RepID=A0ABY7TLI2_9SPHN|nr:hypothetical protein [Sphingomonas naphthae]WCT74102.1 hypothetical protein PQ455_02400 [Sphingomonas naphthae]
MTINMLLICGGIIGLICGFVIARQRFGCIALLVVPIAMIVYVRLWQEAHPENLRSTSGLDFVFGPLWPSLGAIAGFYAARLLREWLVGRNGDGS